MYNFTISKTMIFNLRTYVRKEFSSDLVLHFHKVEEQRQILKIEHPNQSKRGKNVLNLSSKTLDPTIPTLQLINFFSRIWGQIKRQLKLKLFIRFGE